MYLDTNLKYRFFYQNKSNNKKSSRKKEEVRKDSLRRRITKMFTLHNLRLELHHIVRF